MDQAAIAFLENNVCEGAASTLKWGTLVLYPVGFVFYYNKPRNDAPGRMQDVIRLGDLVEIRVEKINWLVSKIFWVGRKKVIVRTKEGEKIYYIKKVDEMKAAISILGTQISFIDTSS